MNITSTLMNRKLGTTLTAGLLSIGLLAGCQSTANMNQPSTQQTQPAPTMNLSYNVLQANDWQLFNSTLANGEKNDAIFYDSNKPLILSFIKDEGRNLMYLRNTCNNIGATYRIVDNDVKLDNVHSTMMACPDAETKFDAAAVNAVVGKYRLGTANGIKVLTVTNEGHTSQYKAIDKIEK